VFKAFDDINRDTSSKSIVTFSITNLLVNIWKCVCPTP